jgi:predicted DNA-binding transcriptional regulator AlpA
MWFDHLFHFTHGMVLSAAVSSCGWLSVGDHMPSVSSDPSPASAPASLSSLFWSDKQVAHRIGCGRASVWKAVRDDADFPKPYRLIGRRIGWKVTEIDAWAARREFAR